MVSASSSKPSSKGSRSESLSAEPFRKDVTPQPEDITPQPEDATPQPEETTPQSPSEAFAASLKARDELSCVKLLNEDFESLTQSGSPFEWLNDTKVLGLTSHEVFNLLIEESDQSPWIYYDLVSPASHEPDMFHRADYNSPDPPQQPGDPTTKISNIVVKRKIAEVCGLGGIIPTPYNSAVWTKEVRIRRDSGRAEIAYDPAPHRVNDPNDKSTEVCLDQCVCILDRLVKLLRWLEVQELVSDHLIIFRVTNQSKVEGVQVPIESITNLSECAKKAAIALAEADESKDNLEELCAAAHVILRLTAWSHSQRASVAISDCALAVQALCITMLTFAQSHIGPIDPFFLEHSLSQVRLLGALTSRRRYVYYRLVSLTCAGDMVDSQVMAFAEHATRNDEPFDLTITPEDILELWGPGVFISSQTPVEEESSEHRLCGIALRGGIIYKPSADSSKMHWKAGAAEDALTEIEFIMDPQRHITIGGVDMVNKWCPTKPDRDNTISRQNIDSVIEELGTWPEKWNIRERQGGLQGGQFLNATFNATWIKSDSRTRKQKGLEQVDLDFLNKPWGLLVSLCTGAAWRVALREIVAEVMLPMMDAWMAKTMEWQVLMSTGDGLLEELRKPTFRSWVSTLKNNEQHALDLVVGHILRKICWTGINDSAKLVVSCPTFDDSDGCVHIPMKHFRALACILKDTERSATFACLTNMCLEGTYAPRCQRKPAPHWQNRISVLATSVCQYQWLGAEDWIKMPQNDLKPGVFYWMGNSEDRRRVTVRDLPVPWHRRRVRWIEPKLSVSNSRSNWRFFRRAWERIEKIRQDCHIELRERSLMAEDYATEVAIMPL